MCKRQQMCKHDASKCKNLKKYINSKCANVERANVQFSILTANVQTRDLTNN